MGIRIGHASIDERGRASGGQAGDQTKKEVCTRTWYNKPWDYYIECTDEKLAEKASKYMEEICANDNVGYNQNTRLTMYSAIKSNGNKVKGIGKCETDCSALISACYVFAGLGTKLNPSCTTRNLRSALVATGKFKVYSSKEYTTSDNLAKRGGIYLKEGSHVVMALEDGKGANKTSNKDSGTSYYPKCKDTYTSLVDALASIGVNISKDNRAKIYVKNFKEDAYKGTAKQNTDMLELLKKGKLKK